MMGLMIDGTAIMAPYMPGTAIIMHVCVCDQASEDEGEEEGAGQAAELLDNGEDSSKAHPVRTAQGPGQPH